MKRAKKRTPRKRRHKDTAAINDLLNVELDDGGPPEDRIDTTRATIVVTPEPEPISAGEASIKGTTVPEDFVRVGEPQRDRSDVVREMQHARGQIPPDEKYLTEYDRGFMAGQAARNPDAIDCALVDVFMVMTPQQCIPANGTHIIATSQVHAIYRALKKAGYGT